MLFFTTYQGNSIVKSHFNRNNDVMLQDGELLSNCLKHQCMHNNIYIHASSSSSTDPSNENIIGLINPDNVDLLTKIGYKITDCSYNEFRFNNIIGFTNGIEFYSEYGDKGTFYNNVYFTAIWRCQRPMKFKTGKASDDTSKQSG